MRCPIVSFPALKIVWIRRCSYHPGMGSHGAGHMANRYRETNSRDPSAFGNDITDGRYDVLSASNALNRQRNGA